MGMNKDGTAKLFVKFVGHKNAEWQSYVHMQQELSAYDFEVLIKRMEDK
jgi:hypothetical protein